VVTVEAIVPIYAPAFENNVPRYIAGVLRRIYAWWGIPANEWPVMPPLADAAIEPDADRTAMTATPTIMPTIPTAPTAALPVDMPPEPGMIRMPDIVGLDLAAAEQVLVGVGVTIGVVDAQGRDHLGGLFDQVGPNTVVSSQPAAGTWMWPEVPVVVGVRAAADGDAGGDDIPPTKEGGWNGT
jgi:hypothetical protein